MEANGRVRKPNWSVWKDEGERGIAMTSDTVEGLEVRRKRGDTSWNRYERTGGQEKKIGGMEDGSVREVRSRWEGNGLEGCRGERDLQGVGGKMRRRACGREEMDGRGVNGETSATEG